MDITRIRGTAAEHGTDDIAIEEPLEIRVGERAISVTMRTPGDDFELAAGFLFTEGIVKSAAQIEGMRHWGSPNVVRVALTEGSHIDWQRLQRNFYATSSCGVCGKASIDALRVAAPRQEHTLALDAEAIHAMPGKLRAAQTQFASTGGIHAAGIFDARGNLLRTREDIGRHNAVDKVIGSFWLENVALGGHVLFVSGRAGFEIVQKAAVAGIPAIAAVGAPSTLAVELAREFNLTLLGFVRDRRFNVYAGADGMWRETGA
ncbi:MAG TPA: formate dehydrogenase accessory sulfurtransferase FdhD [Thermoanaerobaculia bacterium]